MTPIEVPPPNDINLERAVLNTIIVDNDKLHMARSMGFQKSDFYQHRYRHVWDALIAVIDRGDLVDFVALEAELKKNHGLEKFENTPWILDLIDVYPIHIHFETYVKQLLSLSWRRKQLEKAQRTAQVVLNIALGHPLTDQELAEKIQDIWRKDNRAIRRYYSTASNLFEELDSEMRERMKLASQGQPYIGLRTGLWELDQVMAGQWQLGQVTRIQGLSNIGKSFLAIQMAIAASAQVPVLYCTFEGDDLAVGRRMKAIASGVPLTLIQTGAIFRHTTGIRQVVEASSMLAKRPIEFISSVSSVGEIRDHVEDMIVRYDFKRPMVFVDNLNNIAEAMPGEINANLIMVSAQIVQMARETGCGVTDLIQQRNDFAPGMSDSDIRKKLIPTMKTVEYSRKLSQHPHNLFGIYSPGYIADKLVKGHYVDPNVPKDQVLIVNCRQREAACTVSAQLIWDSKVPCYRSKPKPPGQPMWYEYEHKNGNGDQSKKPEQVEVKTTQP